ncbi:MAG: adenylate/guanylate cyclase domain-containing protein [Candidatus Hydrogenedentota bacterium]|nr:MAG: adenylate/guanylate cyclase domain-containing protein [Candidatus Hydrogenedentota bacterium]
MARVLRQEFFDLEEASAQKLKAAIDKVVEFTKEPLFRGPLYLVLFEIIMNALKAVYKKLYYDFMIREAGLSNLSYESWLSIFKAELAEHRAANFSYMAREKNMPVLLQIQFLEDGIHFAVEGPTSMSDIEKQRFEKTLASAKDKQDLSYLFEQEEDNLQEGAGFGLPMVIMTLRNLNIRLDLFQLEASKNKTIVKFMLPANLYEKVPEKVEILSKKELSKASIDLVESLPLEIVIFNPRGYPIQVSNTLLQEFGLSNASPEQLKAIIPEQFFQDIFFSKQGIRYSQQFSNYRIYIPLKDEEGERSHLFNVSGILQSDSNILTVWQEVKIPNVKHKLSEGSILQNLQLQNLIRPYIPAHVLEKAKELVREGHRSLPNESRVLSIMFGDLEGFTALAETLQPEEAITILNVALNVIVKTINRHHGYVDKFMGDGFMAIFDNPENAVLSGIEIQKNFKVINDFREASNEPPLKLRLGLNHGRVILGNIGTPERLEWSVIGDVVNTAARLESKSKVGELLIGAPVYYELRDKLQVKHKVRLKLHGKRKEVEAYFVKAISIQKGDKQVIVSIDE